MLKTIMALRNLDISQESKFDFVLPERCLEWPGPKYGADSPHTEYAKGTKESTTKRQQSQSPLSKVAKAPKSRLRAMAKHTAQSPTPWNDHGPTPRRDPPLHLLTLPAELRNTIYDLLVLQSEPIRAQLRPTIKFDPQIRRSARVIRRHPQEPALALVNHQVRHEVLSIFYGANKFIFQKSVEPLLDPFRITDSDMLTLWNRGDAARYLRHIELYLEVYLREFDASPIKFDVRRLVDGRCTIHFSFRGDEEYCKCTEDASVEEVLNSIDDEESARKTNLDDPANMSRKRGSTMSKDLVAIAADLVSRRREKLKDLAYMSDDETFALPTKFCTSCGQRHFVRSSAG